jgi:hypothetical protein
MMRCGPEAPGARSGRTRHMNPPRGSGQLGRSPPGQGARQRDGAKKMEWADVSSATVDEGAPSPLPP